MSPEHKNTLRTVVLGACLGLSAIVLAAPVENRFPISIDDAEARAAERFASMDSDNSGNVDLAEFEAFDRGHGPRHHGRAARLHASPVDGHGGRGGKRTARHAEIQAELFAIMDKDGDGSLSAEEFQSGNDPQARRLAHKRVAFKRMDVDNDNLLTEEEMTGPLDRLQAADSNGDGQVTKAEMRALRQQHRHMLQQGAAPSDAG